jgi:sugar phosphate isomerase/epimerase
MLLTLSATSLRPLIEPEGAGPAEVDLFDLPAFVRQTLGLHGLNLTTEMLAGADRRRLETLRDRADKAGCACLLLVEPAPQRFGDPDENEAEAAVERTRRVIQAAHLLGCNAAAVRVDAPNDEPTFERSAERIREAVARAERLEMNLLLAPGDEEGGLTTDPERVTELIKRIGGFRVGTFPDFQTAAGTGDAPLYLRRLTPYAAVVSASATDFEEPDDPEAPPRHLAYDLEPLVEAIVSVGYDGTLAIDYRGTDDPTLGVLSARDALEAALMRLAEKK